MLRMALADRSNESSQVRYCPLQQLRGILSGNDFASSFCASFTLLRSPETLRMPSSTVTLTSSFFISGRSALSRYPRSSSLISTSGDQSGTVRPSISPLPILFGKQPKKNALKRFCVACSISLSGFHVITLFNVFILFTFLDSVKAILVRSPLIVRVDPNLVYV